VHRGEGRLTLRRPRRWQLVSFAVLASAVVALALPWWLPAAVAGDGLRGGLFLYGLLALMFGGWGAVSTTRDLRAQAALTRGDGVIARWRLEPDAWRAFLAQEQERQRGGNEFNEFVAADAVPAAGVEVIVGEAAVQIDGSIHRIPLRGVPEVVAAELRDNDEVGAPATVELRLKYPGAASSGGGIAAPTYTRLRFPLPGPAWRDARRVVAHFNRDLPGKADFFHGRGDGSDPEDLSKCWSCGFETHKYRSQCERCGAGLQSRRWSRRLGAVLTLCGLFLTGLMSAVLFFLLPMLLRPGVNVGGSRFDGSPAMAALVMLILGVVFAFGATALGYGIYQMVTGRRSLAVAKVMVAVFSGLLFVASALAWLR
jgi:hypothetical protein